MMMMMMIMMLMIMMMMVLMMMMMVMMMIVMTIMMIINSGNDCLHTDIAELKSLLFVRLNLDNHSYHMQQCFCL